jgi:hypothetical protein
MTGADRPGTVTDFITRCPGRVGTQPRSVKAPQRRTTSGSRRARAVSTGRPGSQVTGHSRRQAPKGKRRHGGFESHLPRRRASSSDARASGRSQAEGRLGTTMPVTRDSPSIQGGVPGPDPARDTLARRLPGGARLSGAAGGGLPCQARSAMRSAAAPRAACLVHVWSTCHRSRAVRSGLQRSSAVRRSRRWWARSWGNRLGADL